MIIEIKIPTPGESITEVELGKWLVEDGDIVEKNQELAEVESDKATLTIVASDAGKISFKVNEGDTVEVGTIASTIDTDFAEEIKKKEEPKPNPQAKEGEVKESIPESIIEKDRPKIRTTAVAQKMMDENDLSVDDVIQGLRRIGKKEIEAVLGISASMIGGSTKEPSLRSVKREKMSMLRRKLSARLVAVKNETAMLTTFNEVDMSRVMAIRKEYQAMFVEKNGFKLGFMSFFTKAVAIALQFHPTVNSMIDGEEIVAPDYVDVGIAVQTPKGLMVPIIRNAESKSISEIELEIKELAEKARSKKISVEGTFGRHIYHNQWWYFWLLAFDTHHKPSPSLRSWECTILLNGLLPLKDKVLVRPMMYLALSYDHRIIDGKDSVGFLLKIKELIEHPDRLVTDGKTLESVLLGL